SASWKASLMFPLMMFRGLLRVTLCSTKKMFIILIFATTILLISIAARELRAGEQLAQAVISARMLAVACHASKIASKRSGEELPANALCVIRLRTVIAKMQRRAIV